MGDEHNVEALAIDDGETGQRGARTVLLVLPDPEAARDVRRAVFGRSLSVRLAEAARAAGFSEVLVGPGVKQGPENAREVSAGDPVSARALVVFESTWIDPRLLELMVEHPLDEDERYTLYDGVGRPAASFTGMLAWVPGTMPISEELDWPEGLGAHDLARVVYPEDAARAERLVMRDEHLLGRARDTQATSAWRRVVDVALLRLLSRVRANVAQLELLALLLGLGAGPLLLLGWWPTQVVAMVAMVAVVEVAACLDALRRLRSEPSPRESARWRPGETLAAAARPLAHASAVAALTYVLVSETDRSSIAALVLLATGIGSVLLTLAHTRALLRGRVEQARMLEIADGEALVHRLGVRVPVWLQGAPWVELAAALLSLAGIPVLPWTVLVIASLSRLWRWFLAPIPRPA